MFSSNGCQVKSQCQFFFTMLSKNDIRDIIFDVFPDESLVEGETKIDYLLNTKIVFENRQSDTGMNLTFTEYAQTISIGILTLKQAYDFLKAIRKDIRKKISPDEVLKELDSSKKLSEKQRRALVQKALEALELEESKSEE